MFSTLGILAPVRDVALPSMLPMDWDESGSVAPPGDIEGFGMYPLPHGSFRHTSSPGLTGMPFGQLRLLPCSPSGGAADPANRVRFPIRNFRRPLPHRYLRGKCFPTGFILPSSRRTAAAQSAAALCGVSHLQAVTCQGSLLNSSWWYGAFVPSGSVYTRWSHLTAGMRRVAVPPGVLPAPHGGRWRWQPGPCPPCGAVSRAPHQCRWHGREFAVPRAGITAGPAPAREDY